MDIRKTPIICYGDSNTYGYDPRSYLGDRYPRQVRWTGILKEQHRLNLINCGMPGREIPRFQYEMQQALNPMASLQPPFFLWIMLGSNDLLNSREPSADTAAGRVEEFLRFLIQQDLFRAGKLKILLISPPRMEPGAWTNGPVCRESGRLGACLKETVRQLCLSESLAPAQLSFADAGSWQLPLVFDGVHLSEEGHLAFAEHMSAFLASSPQIFSGN